MTDPFLRLDFGCGSRKRKNAIGLDMDLSSAADVIATGIQPHLPFADNVFHEIYCDDILEHFLDLIPVLKELWRVAKPGCLIKISSPHFSSYHAYQDPTHRRAFAYRTFDYFDPSSRAVRHKYFQKEIAFSVKSRRICFREYFVPEGLPPFNPFRLFGVELLANFFPKVYERFFCWIVPAVEMYYEIEVVK